jgi:hypothetical protein
MSGAQSRHGRLSTLQEIRMKPVAPNVPPEVGGGIQGPWSDPPVMIPHLPTPPINPFPDPIFEPSSPPSPDLS